MDARDHPTTADYAFHEAFANTRKVEELERRVAALEETVALLLARLDRSRGVSR